MVVVFVAVMVVLVVMVVFIGSSPGNCVISVCDGDNGR